MTTPDEEPAAYARGGIVRGPAGAPPPEYRTLDPDLRRHGLQLWEETRLALRSTSPADLTSTTIKEAPVAKTPQSIKVRVEVDAPPEVLFRALRRHWSDDEIVAAVRGPYADEPLRPEQRRPGQAWPLPYAGPPFAWPAVLTALLVILLVVALLT